MSEWTGLVLTGNGLILRRRVYALPATGKLGEIIVLSPTGEYYEWDGASWLNQGPAVVAGGGGGSPNLDGGTAVSVYGGIDPIDGGVA